MKPIIIRSKKFTKLASVFIDVCAITLYPFIIVSEACDQPGIINHESIHLEQQKELWLIPFYVLYISYWIKGKMQGMTNQAAYMSIPFEKEAYANEKDFNYISNREKQAWKNY